MNGTVVNTFDFCQALLRVLPCASKDDSRPALQSVLFEADIEQQTLRLSCADGFVLARATVDAVVDKSFRKMAPVKAFNWIKAHKLEYSPLTFLINPEMLSDGGSFPQLEYVYPSREPAVVVELSDRLMKNVVAMFKPYARDFRHYGGPVYWSISKGGHVFETKTEDATSHTTFETDVLIEMPFYCCVDYKRLVDLFGGMKYEPQLQARLYAKNAPVEFRTPNQRTSWLIMPMHGDSAYAAREA